MNDGITMIALTIFGYSSYRIWLLGEFYFTKTFLSLLFYSVTLILEWLKVVYGPKQLDFAAVHMAIILLFATVTGVLFFIIDKQAGFLCIIFISWLIFSTFLFYNLWILNTEGDWIENRDDLLNNISSKNKITKS